jgi:hypothetical protein
VGRYREHREPSHQRERARANPSRRKNPCASGRKVRVRSAARAQSERQGIHDGI